MPHAALWVVQLRKGEILVADYASFNAARGFVCGAARTVQRASWLSSVSMPHAALCVVQHLLAPDEPVFLLVSMPHAALCVVQLRRSQPLSP